MSPSIPAILSGRPFSALLGLIIPPSPPPSKSRIVPIIRRAVLVFLLLLLDRAGFAAISGDVKAAAERVVIDACD